MPLIERYKPGAAAESIKRLAASRDQFDALFIPEQADSMSQISKELTANNLDSKKVQIIGTGLWNDPRALGLPGLQGAWFSAPENAGFNAFAQTSIEDTMRSHGVRHVLIAGSFTSMCVDSSGRAAFDLGFDVTILTDCIVGRTKFEDEFYCSSIFPLYANTATSSQMLEQLRGSGAD